MAADEASPTDLLAEAQELVSLAIDGVEDPNRRDSLWHAAGIIADVEEELRRDA